MKHLSFVILASLILFSGCKQSSDVVSGSFLQKKEVKKGFHLKPLKHKQDNPKNISLDSALCF